MGDKEILDNIKYEISDYFSIDMDKYTVTYRILAKEDRNGKTVLRVLGVAVPSDLIAGYVRIVGKAGFKITYVDVGINACLKMIKHIKEDISSGKTACILDYGHRTLTISLFDDGAPFITRVVERNWEVQNIDMVAMILSQVLDYYYSRNHTSYVEKVWVVGGNGYTNGFCQHLSMRAGIDVQTMRPDMFTFDYSDNQNIPIGVYLKSIGSAIRED